MCRKLIYILVLITLLLTGSTPAKYTEADVELMAKTVYGEARGCSPEEQALVVWCVLQRVDDGGFGESIKEVITAPGQFQGYDADNLMWEDIYNLCAEEMTKWAQGEEPPTHEAYAPETPYLYFNGKNGHNWFRRFYDE